MTIYASRTPESMNNDHRAWGDDSGQRHMWIAGVIAGLQYDPRPEYTPETTHPANPILVEFREYGEAGAALWLETLNGYSSTYDYVDVVDDAIEAATPEQIDHARRVLTRLANFR